MRWGAWETIGAVACLVWAAGPGGEALTGQSRVERPTGEGAVEGVHRITELGPGIWVAEPRFGGANAVVIENGDHVVVVDPHSDPATARALAEEAWGLTGLPIRIVVNTHWHSDHHGGNRALQELSPQEEIRFIGHETLMEDIPGLAAPELSRMAPFYGTWVDAAQAALEVNQLPLGGEPTAGARRQVERFVADLSAFVAAPMVYEYLLPSMLVSEVLALEDGPRRIHIRHPGPAHTRGDLWVHLPDDGIVIAGDLLTAPYIVPRSGYPVGYARALRSLAGLGDRIVLGHGGPVKENGDLALMMAEFLEATVEYAEKARNEGLSPAEAREAAAADPLLSPFEDRIDWEEPGLRFLDFAALVSMTVARAIEEGVASTPP